jgi:cytochrome c-type biogenesis protein CcmE
VKPKRKRLYIVGLALLCMGAAAALVLTAFEDNIVFFYSPSDLTEKSVAVGRTVRIGGLVAENSVEKNDATVTFTVTDLNQSVRVAYTGILPDLFREGQGVVAEGKIGADGLFKATEVLAKHDENYMPKEVADALKASGQWKHAEEAAQ